MKNQPLPRELDARKFARAGIDIEASEPVASFPRFAEALADENGEVWVALSFFRDEGGGYRLAVKTRSEVALLCQRCLEGKPSVLESASVLALVWTDEEAKSLPKDLDPLILGEEPLDVLAMLEDELIVSTPFVAYHEAPDCGAEVNPGFGDDTIDESQTDNPFAVLASLKQSPKK